MKTCIRYFTVNGLNFYCGFNYLVEFDKETNKYVIFNSSGCTSITEEDLGLYFL